jgi:ribosomal protein S18 acetylase RimI-like enzyme
MTDEVVIATVSDADSESLCALWEACGLLRPWNDPRKDIHRALGAWPDLFLKALRDDRIIGSAMAGYDGHRGNVYYLAVAPDCQGLGIGRRLMDSVTERLLTLGCPKLHVMIRHGNEAVIRFYENQGYKQQATALYGRRLIADD